MTIVAGRYRLEHKLGEGGFGSTWSAIELDTEQRVALKQLDVRRAKDWKSLELFEREAHVLRGLSHPAIPRYFDSFEAPDEDGSENACFYLAQALAPGKALVDWIDEDGWRPDNTDLFELASKLLDVLVYLHELHPPVVHRDIKPHNILRDEHGVISLVDFGSVKSSLDEDNGGGSTVVGTFGYMAPEQFRGHADPRTDLYGLGATLIYVMTHREPSALPTKKLAIDIRAVLPSEDESLLCWLEKLLEPDMDDRFQNAREARDALERISRGEQVDFPTSTTIPSYENQSGESDASEESLAAENQPDNAGAVEPQARMRPGDKGWEASMKPLSPMGRFVMGGLLLTAISVPLWGPLGASIFAGVAMPFLALFFGVTFTPDDAGNHPQSQWRDSVASVVGCFAGSVGQTIFICLALMMYSEVGAFLTVWSAIWALLYWGVGWLFVPTYKSFEHQMDIEETLGAEIPMPTGDRHLRLRIDEYEPGVRAKLSEYSRVNAVGWSLTGVLMVLVGAFVANFAASFGGGAAAVGFGGIITASAIVSGLVRLVRKPEIEISAEGLKTSGSIGKHILTREEIDSYKVAVDATDDETSADVQLWVHRTGVPEPTLVYSLSEPNVHAAKLQAGLIEEMTATIWEPERQLVFDWRGESMDDDVMLAENAEELAEERARQKRWEQW